MERNAYEARLTAIVPSEEHMATFRMGMRKTEILQKPDDVFRAPIKKSPNHYLDGGE